MTAPDAGALTFYIVLGLLALYGIGCVIVGGYRYYRDHKPNRRVGLPQPHYDDRNSIDRFNRNVGRG